MSPIMPKQDDIVNQSAGAPERDVLELVHAVMHRYRSQQHRVLRDGPHAITHMDSKVLGFFGSHPGATQSDLVQHSGRDKAQLARLIKGMRERGLLAAQADAEDKRNLKLSLTPAGQAVQRSLKRQSMRLGTRAVAGMSMQEQRQLADLLRRMKENLESLD
jgi:DNA-binding MarR family transcriptional regulator